METIRLTHEELYTLLEYSKENKWIFTSPNRVYYWLKDKKCFYRSFTDDDFNDCEEEIYPEWFKVIEKEGNKLILCKEEDKGECIPEEFYIYAPVNSIKY